MSKIKNIKKIDVGTKRFYNLAVKNDESYIANGICVHNCRSIIVPVAELKILPTSNDTVVGKLSGVKQASEFGGNTNGLANLDDMMWIPKETEPISI